MRLSLHYKLSVASAYTPHSDCWNCCYWFHGCYYLTELWNGYNNFSLWRKKSHYETQPFSSNWSYVLWSCLCISMLGAINAILQKKQRRKKNKRKQIKRFDVLLLYTCLSEWYFVLTIICIHFIDWFCQNTTQLLPNSFFNVPAVPENLLVLNNCLLSHLKCNKVSCEWMNEVFMCMCRWTHSDLWILKYIFWVVVPFFLLLFVCLFVCFCFIQKE